MFRIRILALGYGSGGIKAGFQDNGSELIAGLGARFSVRILS